VLRPDGAMNLMVYAPYGRSGIYLLQDYCRRLGIAASAQEMEDLVAVLETLPPRHPLTALLSEARDFRNPDALADALLNPRDRSYSVPQLFEFLERSGLTFGRWYLQAPYLPQCGAIAATPHAARLAALSEREQYAAVELWRGTIARHSVLACCSDASAAGAKVRFDDERWRRYVPVRRPASICVKERLPAGAAGVLLNRSHAPHHDLILVIDAHEKQMVDAIDGRRTIADIVDHVRSTAVSAVERLHARALFEKLWRYDQVVFDASKIAGTA
jgi:hypothetical protein